MMNVKAFQARVDCFQGNGTMSIQHGRDFQKKIDPQNGSTMQIVYPKIAKLQNALHLCFYYKRLMDEFMGGWG